ncbi:MAG: ribonuclease [Parasporobacterium sp.]|nr:ribonuclease [Parasporobacterium sp.]
MMLLALTAFSGCAGAGGRSGKNQPQTTETASAQEQTTSAASQEQTTAPQKETIREDGEYYTKDDVAEYLHLYEHLPDNYITKSEAKKLGWVSNKGNLWDVAPGKCIGGDNFGNREGHLPEKKSRKYYECDVNYEGGYRQDDRIIYSNDGLIYFTEDHYNTFELLYGEED